jgi:hypothetical protein
MVKNVPVRVRLTGGPGTAIIVTAAGWHGVEAISLPSAVVVMVGWFRVIMGS